MHRSYEEILGHRADFRVRYRFFDENEGGRSSMPVQGIRLDFYYEHDKHEVKGNFIIWPEFEDHNFEVILDASRVVSREGTARMWIINPSLRHYHQQRLCEGRKGYFIEGKRVADCEIIELVSLLSNPTSSR